MFDKNIEDALKSCNIINTGESTDPFKSWDITNTVVSASLSHSPCLPSWGAHLDFVSSLLVVWGEWGVYQFYTCTSLNIFLVLGITQMGLRVVVSSFYESY